jgi:hypothetical protein
LKERFFMKRLLAMVPLILLLTQINFVNARNQRILAWGIQGEGTYKNPILKSDYSDPDILRRTEMIFT